MFQQNLSQLRQRYLVLNPNMIKSGYKELQSVELRGLNKKRVLQGEEQPTEPMANSTIHHSLLKK